MKRVLALFIAAVLCGAVAKAGDVKVDVTMTTNPGGEETSSFACDAPKYLRSQSGNSEVICG
jgi:hypothetical protein